MLLVNYIEFPRSAAYDAGIRDLEMTFENKGFRGCAASAANLTLDPTTWGRSMLWQAGTGPGNRTHDEQCTRGAWGVTRTRRRA